MNLILKIGVLIGLIRFFPYKLFINLINPGSYCWMPITSLLIFTGLLGLFTKKIIANKCKTLADVTNIFENLDFKDKVLGLLALTACLSATKSFFFLNLGVYGQFMLPLLLIVNIVFWNDYIPKIFKFIDKKTWSSASLIIFTAISLLFMFGNIKKAGLMANTPIKTNKGTIYTDRATGESFNQTIDFIKANTQKDSYVLVMPEGAMINFLTERRTSGLFYSLLPINIETYGEDNIIKELKKNPPDYIVINARNSSDYGAAFFGADYGFKIYDFIKNQYNIEKTINNNFATVIYKKKAD